MVGHHEGFRRLLDGAEQDAYSTVRASQRTDPDEAMDAQLVAKWATAAELESAAVFAPEESVADRQLSLDVERLSRRRDGVAQQLDQAKATLADREDAEAELASTGRIPAPNPWVVAALLLGFAAVATLSLQDVVFRPLFPGKRLLPFYAAFVASLFLTAAFVLEPVHASAHPVPGQRRWPRVVLKAAVALLFGAGLTLLRWRFVRTPVDLGYALGLALVEVAFCVASELYAHHLSNGVEYYLRESLGATKAAALCASARRLVERTQTALEEIQRELDALVRRVREREHLRRAAALLKEAVGRSVAAGLRRGYEENRGLTYGGLHRPGAAAHVRQRIVVGGKSGEE